MEGSNTDAPEEGRGASSRRLRRAAPLASERLDENGAQALSSLKRALRRRSKIPSRIGRYTVGELLGAGAGGQVHVAHDTWLGREVAIKFVIRETQAGTEASQRLLREARALASVDHPNVVTLYDAGLFDDDEQVGVYIVLELLSGQSVAQWQSEPRTEAEILDVFLPAGSGLAACHGLGLLHRDFKPANMVVTKSGVAKVVDFGLALDESASRAPDSLPLGSLDATITPVGASVGTLRYMAPELSNCQRATAASDQYAFAVSLLEVLTAGRGSTVGGKSPTELLAALPRPLAQILARALASDPEARWPNLSELLVRLQAYRRRRRRWTLSALVVLAVCSFAALFVLAEPDPPATHQCQAAAFEALAVWPGGDPESFASSLELPREQDRAQRQALVVAALVRHHASMVNYLTDLCKLDQQDAVVIKKRACAHSSITAANRLAEVLLTMGELDPVRAIDAAYALPKFTDCEAAGADHFAPTDAPARRLLDQASTLIDLRDYDAALRLLDEVEPLTSADRGGTLHWEVAERLGRVALGRGDHDEARRVLEPAAWASLYRGDQRAAVMLAFHMLRLESSAGRVEIARFWSQHLGALRPRRWLHPLAVAEYEATILSALGRFTAPEEADAIAGRVQTVLDEVGDDLPREAVSCYLALARHHTRRGAYDRAESLLRDALELALAVYGAESRPAMDLSSQLGHVLHLRGDSAEARELRERVLAQAERIHGANSPSLARYLNNLALHMLRDEGLEQALAYFEHAAENLDRNLTINHRLAITIHGNRGTVLWRLGRLEQAEAAGLLALQLIPDDAATAAMAETRANLHSLLGVVHRDQGSLERALEDHHRALEHLANANPRPESSLDLYLDAAETNIAAGQLEPAAVLLARVSRILRATSTGDHRILIEHAQRLGRAYASLHDGPGVEVAGEIQRWHEDRLRRVGQLEPLGERRSAP